MPSSPPPTQSPPHHHHRHGGIKKSIVIGIDSTETYALDVCLHFAVLGVAFVCIEVLGSSQPYGGHVQRGHLPNNTFTGQA